MIKFVSPCNTVLVTNVQKSLQSESHQILVTWVLIFGSSPHCAGKCMAKLYAVYIAGAWQSLRKKYVFELSTHLQFSHSNSFILSRQVLCWPCFDRFSSYGRRSRRTRLLFAKNNWFRFSSVQLHAFECIIQSTMLLLTESAVRTRKYLL